MIKKTKILGFVSLLLILFNQYKIPASFANEIESVEEQELLIWRVDSKPKSDRSVYILGSYHVGKTCNLNSRAFEYAFEDAEKIVFEIDMNSINDPAFSAKVQQVLFKLIQEKGLPETYEESLKGILDSETYESLKEKVATKGMSIDSIAHLKPWVFLLMQQSLEMGQQINTEQQKLECGLDFMINKQAQSQNKPTMGLETADYQIEMFVDLFANTELEKIREYIKNFIGSGVSTNEFFNQDISNIISSIDQGNVSQLEDLINGWCESDAKSCQSLLIDRNYNWMPTIENFLQETEDKLVVVGAGHLVGEDGIINLLEKQGYRVRRLRNSQLE